MKHFLLTTIAAVVLVGCGNPDGALIQAAKDGNIEAAKQAINAGADVNAKGNYGLTPLYWAAQSGYKEVAELLITKGADVNAKDMFGKTPLDMAVASTQMAEFLRKHGGKGSQDNAAQRPDPKGGDGQSREERHQEHIKAIEQKLGIKSSPDNIKY